MNTEIRFLAQHLLHAGLGPLPDRDRRVISRVAKRMHTARNLNQVFDSDLTFGDRLADQVAAIGGSWAFIIGFMLTVHPFDPYPFIFLNLLLSMLAALQAPVIMMSQNRQAAKDRLAAALDYEVNVKAEAAIAELHDKVDRLAEVLERREAPDAGASALGGEGACVEEMAA